MGYDPYAPASRFAKAEPVEEKNHIEIGPDYSSMKVDELKAEIEKRNQDRDDENKISDEGKKADLVAALEADDAREDLI